MSHAPATPSNFMPDLKERSRQRRFALEALEPRWLLSATPLSAALQAALPQLEQERLWQAPAPSPVAELATPDCLDLS